MASLALAGLFAPLGVATAGQSDHEQINAKVLFAYTEEAKDLRGGTSQIKALIRQGLANGNEALDNSFAGAHWGEGDIVEVIYTNRTNASGTLADWNREDDINTVDGEVVGDIIDERFHDMHCLFTDWAGNENGLAGVGQQTCIVKPDSIEFLTVAHELGHLYNCAHSQGTQFNNGRRTIMDSGATSHADRVPFFSNANVSYQGQATGAPVSRDNAGRIMRDANRKAIFREGLYDGQVIALQSNTGLFASSEGARTQMSASRTSPGRWEVFNVDQVGSQWTFEGSHGFVSSESGSAAGMNANRANPGRWERFNYVFNQGMSTFGDVPSTISLEGVGGFVSSNNNMGDSSVKMTADRPSPGGWERWSIWTP